MSPFNVGSGTGMTQARLLGSLGNMMPQGLKDYDFSREVNAVSARQYFRWTRRHEIILLETIDMLVACRFRHLQTHCLY